MQNLLLFIICTHRMHQGVHHKGGTQVETGVVGGSWQKVVGEEKVIT